MLELPDDALDYLGEVRSTYLAVFRDQLAAMVGEAPPAPGEVLVEATMAVADGEPEIRFDIVDRRGEALATTMVLHRSACPTTPTRYPLDGGATLVVHELVWFAATMLGRPAPADTAFIAHWYRRWLADGFELDDAPFGGYVHFMSDVEVAPEGFRVDFDFGSAPVEALRELVELYTLAGVREIHLLSYADALAGGPSE